jgi:hypothetical protein
MSDPNTPGDKPDAQKTAAEAIKSLVVDSPLHEAVFGNDPDGGFNDTPRGAIGDNVNIVAGGYQGDNHQPLRHIGDSEAGDFQPGGGRRR